MRSDCDDRRNQGVGVQPAVPAARVMALVGRGTARLGHGSRSGSGAGTPRAGAGARQGTRRWSWRASSLRKSAAERFQLGTGSGGSSSGGGRQRVRIVLGGARRVRRRSSRCGWPPIYLRPSRGRGEAAVGNGISPSDTPSAELRRGRGAVRLGLQHQATPVRSKRVPCWQAAIGAGSESRRSHGPAGACAGQCIWGWRVLASTGTEQVGQVVH